jgi:hypothetical protein
MSCRQFSALSINPLYYACIIFTIGLNHSEPKANHTGTPFLADEMEKLAKHHKRATSASIAVHVILPGWA